MVAGIPPVSATSIKQKLNMNRKLAVGFALLALLIAVTTVAAAWPIGTVGRCKMTTYKPDGTVIEIVTHGVGTVERNRDGTYDVTCAGLTQNKPKAACLIELYGWSPGITGTIVHPAKQVGLTCFADNALLP